MIFKVRSNSTLYRDLGEAGVEFLEYGIAALTRILPHVETGSWKVEHEAFESGPSAGSVTFTNAQKTQLRLDLEISLPLATGLTKDYAIRGILERRKIPTGVGSIQRTISVREKDIAERILSSIAATLGPADPFSATSLVALRAGFDERVVARHLVSYHLLMIDLGEWFTTLRRLAEQTYENKSMAFGCVIDPKAKASPGYGSLFPQDFLEYKKYRALSDGYRTAYRVSRSGALLGFIHLQPGAPEGTHYFPEWCDGIATAARGKKLGIALTRQGDIVVIDEGHLTFTYRFGRWQYWNHTHVVDLITNAARVQHVPPKLLSGVVRSIYRAALDVSFRHSGGLFVLLRNKQKLHEVVRDGDAVLDVRRTDLDQEFDVALGRRKAQSLPRSLLTELSTLDGAVVLSNQGDLLAYGAILEPRKKGKVSGAEGSRTKAAIGASKYGLSVKISSDGDIKVYVDGKTMLAMN